MDEGKHIADAAPAEPQASAATDAALPAQPRGEAATPPPREPAGASPQPSPADPGRDAAPAAATIAPAAPDAAPAAPLAEAAGAALEPLAAAEAQAPAGAEPAPQAAAAAEPEPPAVVVAATAGGAALHAMDLPAAPEAPPVEVAVEPAPQAAAAATPEPRAVGDAAVADTEPPAADAALVTEPEAPAVETMAVAERELLAVETAAVAEPEPPARKAAVVAEPVPPAAETAGATEPEPAVEAVAVAGPEPPTGPTAPGPEPETAEMPAEPAPQAQAAVPLAAAEPEPRSPEPATAPPEPHPGHAVTAAEPEPQAVATLAAAPPETRAEALQGRRGGEATALAAALPSRPAARTAPAWPRRLPPTPARGARHPAGRGYLAYVRLALMGIAALGVGFVALVLALVVLYRWVDPPISTLMLGQRLAGMRIERHWMPLERMSPHLVKAVVLSEDGGFCRHRGVDWSALEEAMENARGGSTITMQVVKNLFLWPSRSYVRKAIEIALAYVVELIWPKRRILEIYLNIAEWGDGVFGAEAAAQLHFRKAAARLTAAEAALLAVALPNPAERDASSPSPGMRRLATRLLVRMTASRASLACVRMGPRTH